MTTTTETTTQDWLDRLNDEYLGIAQVENGGDWVAYDLPRPTRYGTLRVVVDGELERLRVIAMERWTVEWEVALDLATPLGILVAIVNEACEIDR